MQTLPFKYIVQAVALQLDDGKPVGEVFSDQVALYGRAAVAEWIEQCEAALADTTPEGDE